MKKCFKCGLEKDISEFYVHKKMLDGHLNKCKECTKKDTFGITKEQIEKRKERDRNRPNAKERVLKNCQRIKNNEEARIKNNENKKEWYKKNKHKKYANNLVMRALYSGKLIRPLYCEKCNSDLKIEAHHEDYDKPYVVVWLCVECHSNRHKELNKIKRGINE